MFWRSGRPACGYEITAWLRGTGLHRHRHALLVRVEQHGPVDVKKTEPEETVETVEVRGRTCYGDMVVCRA
ncbi:hypothetical protein ACIBQ1_51480 [Nonomuraea sp. NPDC050153]|uniref:hypothetical protein n=1 Tax=Nonomuraea sp. NPDC050153 TaxID=3364359 RepID=UPI003794B207